MRRRTLLEAEGRDPTQTRIVFQYPHALHGDGSDCRCPTQIQFRVEFGRFDGAGQVAQGGFSAPNIGMLRTGTRNTTAGAAADTLLLLRARRPAIPVASRPCRIGSAAICVALRGDRTTTIRPGDILAVGSSRIGYRLLLISSVDGPYAAPCGADCSAATFCALDTAPGITVVEVLLGIRTPTGATGASCSESFFPDGSRCQETRVSRTTSLHARSVCSATGSQALFTDIRTADRTATLGFPAAREWSSLSGGGAPSVAAVPVEPLRFFAVTEGTELAIHMARGMAAGGTWNSPRRIAGPVASFRVETRRSLLPHRPYPLSRFQIRAYHRPLAAHGA